MIYQCKNVDQLMRFPSKLASHVKKKVHELHLKQFDILFNGWTDRNTHYVAAIQTFPFKPFSRYQSMLLPIDLMGDKNCTKAVGVFKDVKILWFVDGETMANVVVNIEDKEKTNNAFGRQARLTFFACYSHRYSMSEKDFIAEQKDTIGIIRNPIRRLSFQFNFAFAHF